MKDTSERFIITDDDLLDIVKPLTNLIPEWQARLKGRSVNIDFAVQIGTRLEKEGQRRFLTFLADHVVPEKQKVLRAFALDMRNDPYMPCFAFLYWRKTPDPPL
ncbi:hypothetical protein [Cohnella hongkongensis]|uniref:Uncharacterized protein n=1 Tax=Cohnella hongkongensis TaxID=178337 RepID=A0ABV9FLP6_9BACL